jgi:hypothetical protein
MPEAPFLFPEQRPPSLGTPEEAPPWWGVPHPGIVLQDIYRKDLTKSSGLVFLLHKALCALCLLCSVEIK